MKPSSFILHPSSFRKGFSLPEVMFAIMILGIGFIMVAAMFPVAIMQSKQNKESVTATMVAQRAMRALEQAGQSTTGGASVLPTTTGTYSYTQNLANLSTFNPSFSWMSVRGEMIEPSDPRFAWVALYSRANVFPAAVPPAEVTANVVVFVVGCQETSQYDPATDVGVGGAGMYPPTLFNLQPKLLEAQSAAGNRLTFQEATAASFGGAIIPPGYTALGALAEGAYVLIASGPAVGRIVQLTGYDTGTQIGDVRVTDDATGIAAGTPVWVVGRTYIGGTYQGKVQDIAVYKSVIRVPYQ